MREAHDAVGDRTHRHPDLTGASRRLQVHAVVPDRGSKDRSLRLHRCLRGARSTPPWLRRARRRCSECCSLRLPRSLKPTVDKAVYLYSFSPNLKPPGCPSTAVPWKSFSFRPYRRRRRHGLGLEGRRSTCVRRRPFIPPSGWAISSAAAASMQCLPASPRSMPSYPAAAGRAAFSASCCCRIRASARSGCWRRR